MSEDGPRGRSGCTCIDEKGLAITQRLTPSPPSVLSPTASHSRPAAHPTRVRRPPTRPTPARRPVTLRTRARRPPPPATRARRPLTRNLRLGQHRPAPPPRQCRTRQRHTPPRISRVATTCKASPSMVRRQMDRATRWWPCKQKGWRSKEGHALHKVVTTVVIDKMQVCVDRVCSGVIPYTPPFISFTLKLLLYNILNARVFVLGAQWTASRGEGEGDTQPGYAAAV